MDNLELKEAVARIIDELARNNCITENGYFQQDRRSFGADVERAALHGWASTNIRAGCPDFNQFVRKVAVTFDHYAPQLFRLLLPADQTKPQSCPMYRSALNLICNYPQLRKFQSPDDALSGTLDIILFSRLAILGFKEESALRTWVYSILRHVVLQAARKEKNLVELHCQVEARHSGPAREQPDQLQEQAESLGRQLSILEQMVREGQGQSHEAKNSPRLERAWVLWNDYFADLYILLGQDGWRDRFEASPPFPLPPQGLVLGEKGGHNLPYTNYLAAKIGMLRQWDHSRIEADLALRHTPADESRLRAAVRTRRNEAKMFFKKMLEKSLQNSTKEADSAT